MSRFQESCWQIASWDGAQFDLFTDLGISGTPGWSTRSRVDALAPACKGLLQLAATVGLSFSPGLLARAAGGEDIGPSMASQRRWSPVRPPRREAAWLISAWRPKNS